MTSPSPSPRASGRRPRRAAAALGALLLTAGPLALAPPAAARSGPSEKTTLRVAMDSIGVDTLNPFRAFFNGALNTFALIYPTLDRLDYRGHASPYLADSWKTSKDRRTWTFTIHRGLKWSDGTPLTAADAAWTFNLIMHNATAATANGQLVANFEKVTAPSPTKLVITTKKPQANMLAVSIPQAGIPIVPEHIWRHHVKDLGSFNNEAPPVVGYGPWKLTAYKNDQYIKFAANRSFHLGAPKFGNLLMQLFKTTDSAVAALRSGQLDDAGELDSTQYRSLKSARGISAYRQTGTGWTGVEINSGARTRTGKHIGTANPALADPRVRTAIASAIDRQRLVDKVKDGYAGLGEGYLPPSMPQFAWKPDGKERIPFDPAAARRLLDRAGYEPGPGGIRIDPTTHKPLDLRLGIHADDHFDADIANYLTGWLKEIGIKATIQGMSSTKLNADLAKGDWDMLMDGWTTGPDPTYLLGIQTCATLPQDNGQGGNTDSFHCDPSYDRLFARQQSAFDPAQRAAIIRQMQSKLYRADNNVMMYYSDSLEAVRSDRVTGLVRGTPQHGTYPAQDIFTSYLKAAPVQSAGASATGATLGGLGGAAALAALIAGGFAVYRRRTADDRE